MRSFRLEKAEGQELPPFVWVLFILAGVASGPWLLGVGPILLACAAAAMLFSAIIFGPKAEGLGGFNTAQGVVLYVMSTFVFTVMAIVLWAVFTAL